MAFMLGCEKVRVDFPTKTVFESVSLGVDEGDRIGIVGRNGDGKSTLLSVMAGMLEPDEGRVLRNGAVRVGVLGQFDKLSDDDTVERAVVGDIPEYEWAGDARIRDIIAGLASDIPWDAKVGTAASAAASTWCACSSATGTSWPLTSLPTTWTFAPSPGWRTI